MGLTIQYVTISDVAAALNASYDSANNVYMVYGLQVSLASFQAHVDYANIYANAIVGVDLDESDPRYNWAKLVALNLACLRILVAASGGMLMGAFDYRIGDIDVSRATIGRLAYERAVEEYRENLLKALMNFARPAAAAEASAKDEVPTYRGGIINP